MRRCALLLSAGHSRGLDQLRQGFQTPPNHKTCINNVFFYNTLQKLFCHAKLAEDSSRPVLDGVASLWNMLLVRGLGLIPIREHLQEKDDQACAAFEILRVSAVQPSD